MIISANNNAVGGDGSTTLEFLGTKTHTGGSSGSTTVTETFDKDVKVALVVQTNDRVFDVAHLDENGNTVEDYYWNSGGVGWIQSISGKDVTYKKVYTASRTYVCIAYG